MGVAGWETMIVEQLPENMRGSLPTVGEIEAALGMPREVGRGGGREEAAGLRILAVGGCGGVCDDRDAQPMVPPSPNLVHVPLHWQRSGRDYALTTAE